MTPRVLLRAAVLVLSFLTTGLVGAQHIGDPYTTPVVLADADQDGLLTMRDAMKMQEILFSRAAPAISDTALDYNQDGAFNIADAIALAVAIMISGPTDPPVVFHKVVKGDANGDGRVDHRDVSALASWLDGGRIVNPLDTVDLDGIPGVTSGDLAFLRRFVLS